MSLRGSASAGPQTIVLSVTVRRDALANLDYGPVVVVSIDVVVSGIVVVAGGSVEVVVVVVGGRLPITKVVFFANRWSPSEVLG